MNISDNVKRIRDEIGEAAAASGRSPRDITLVAAAKMNSADSVRQAIEAGVDAVGENRVQELLEKKVLGAYNGAPLHFIGHLQSNKARRIVGQCELIESVSSAALLEIINNAALLSGIIQNVLIEVNIGNEAAKSGVMPEKTAELLDFASGFTGVNILGLMAIPPFSANNSLNKHYFDAMYKLFIDMSGKKYDNVSMRILSMGMSESFKDAIQSGANMVRIGSAIFGQRKV